MFANHSDEDEIYPLRTEKIAEAQQADASLKHLFKHNAEIDKGSEIKLIENMTCTCKDGRLVIPKQVQVCVVKWYHHYLQHPGHTHLKETTNAAMHWKGMGTTSERQNLDLAKLILTAAQINLNLLQCSAQIH